MRLDDSKIRFEPSAEVRWVHFGTGSKSVVFAGYRFLYFSANVVVFVYFVNSIVEYIFQLSVFIAKKFQKDSTINSTVTGKPERHYHKEGS